MPPINANVTNQQITASVGETQIDVSVAGGFGPSGANGAAASVTVGTVTTGAPGSSASVVNAGSSSAAVLNFTIPAGATGAQGQAGATGAQGIQGIQGPAGPAGPTGATGATGPAGSNATATTDASALVSGTLPDARLSSNIARTSDVTTAVANVVNAAPAALDTLNELAAALGNDASFSATVTNALAAKAPLASPTFTGTVSGNLLAINSAGGFGVNHGLVLNSSGILHQSIVGGLTQTNFVLAPNGTITTGTWQASAIGVAYGGTGATTASAARTNLGLVIGTDVPALSHTHSALEVTSGQFDIARIPSLPASQIGSGVLATARLGTGTASASNYLRGDGAWVAAPVTSVNGQTGAVTVAVSVKKFWWM